MQKCIIFILLLFGSLSPATGSLLSPTDSLFVHTVSKDPSFFRRLYDRVYRYFIESNEEKEEKRFDFSVIGGPHFSSDTKLGLGLVASGLYRIDRTDRSISPSNISFYSDVTTTGFYLLGIRGNTIFPHDKYRLGLNFYFFSFTSN